MGGIYLTDRDLQELINRGEIAGLDRYLAGRKPGYINSCYGYLGGPYVPCKPVCTCLTYAAKENRLEEAKVMLKYGACFEEVKHPLYRDGKNTVNEAAAPELKVFFMKELLGRIAAGRRCMSGAHGFYIPAKTGIEEGLRMAANAGALGAGPFMISSLAAAIAAGDFGAAGRMLRAAKRRDGVTCE